MKRISLNEAAQWLLAQDQFLILTHRRPDGDTLGSAAALCLGLRQLGKTAAILENPQTTPRYAAYLEGLTTPTITEGMHIISVDLASEGLFPLSAADLTQPVQLSIDHHGSNAGYAAATLLASECAACGELIFALLQQMQVSLDQKIADALYLAISTDTGCFRYANVTAQTMRIAAQLMEAGAQAYAINKTMFETKRYARLQLEANLTQNLEFFCQGQVGIACISQALRKELSLNEDDLDDISGFARDIEGVEIGVMIREQEDGSCKLSVRSSPRYDACAICAVLGGGGHKAASGATLSSDIAETKAAILGAITQIYPNLQ